MRIQNKEYLSIDYEMLYLLVVVWHSKVNYFRLGSKPNANRKHSEFRGFQFTAVRVIFNHT